MNMSPKEYNRYVARLAKKSPLEKDLLNSFLIGGLICVIGQLILNATPRWNCPNRMRQRRPRSVSCF